LYLSANQKKKRDFGKDRSTGRPVEGEKQKARAPLKIHDPVNKVLNKFGGTVGGKGKGHQEGVVVGIPGNKRPRGNQRGHHYPAKGRHGLKKKEEKGEERFSRRNNTPRAQGPTWRG